MDVLTISAMMLKVCYLGQHKRWNKNEFDIGLDKRGHYRDIELIGHSNLISSILLTLKWLAVIIMLYFLLIPFYFIPLLNIIAFNFPLYYFFHNMLTHDISTNICTKEEDKQIRFFAKNELRIKTLLLYLISLIPFAIFFGAVFYVIYLGHTYFKEVKKLRDQFLIDPPEVRLQSYRQTHQSLSVRLKSHLRNNLGSTALAVQMTLQTNSRRG